jgi:hypothetical protein
VAEVREGEGGSNEEHIIVDETSWNVGGESEHYKFIPTSAASVALASKL